MTLQNAIQKWAGVDQRMASFNAALATLQNVASSKHLDHYLMTNSFVLFHFRIDCFHTQCNKTPYAEMLLECKEGRPTWNISVRLTRIAY